MPSLYHWFSCFKKSTYPSAIHSGFTFPSVSSSHFPFPVLHIPKKNRLHLSKTSVDPPFSKIRGIVSPLPYGSKSLICIGTRSVRQMFPAFSFQPDPASHSLQDLIRCGIRHSGNRPDRAILIRNAVPCSPWLPQIVQFLGFRCFYIVRQRKDNPVFGIIPQFPHQASI